ncbi:MAG: hypothetical protein R3252_09830 [Robiginitalea sp.]|nr:hypothetical protein [Robiginitalea sp.]
MKLTAAFMGMLLGLSLVSCEWFASREKKTRELVEQEMRSINWNEVDQFPLFEACDETASKPEQQECFQNTLVMHLSMSLQDFEFRSDQPLSDTLYVDFLVDNQGSLSVLSVEENPLLTAENPEFERIVSGTLQSLPRLQPALKRGIPVSARFRIPLVIESHE